MNFALKIMLGLINFDTNPNLDLGGDPNLNLDPDNIHGGDGGDPNKVVDPNNVDDPNNPTSLINKGKDLKGTTPNGAPIIDDPTANTNPRGQIANSAPPPLAIPIPPRNPAYNGQQCPIITIPAANASVYSEPPSRCASHTAK